MGKHAFCCADMKYLTPGQKQARYIRRLERLVAGVGAICMVMAVIICVLITHSI